MNADTSSFSSPDRFRLDSLRNCGWEWLLDLRRRLKVTVQLVDTHLEPVLPYTEGLSAAALERALASRTPVLRAALGHVMQSKAARAVAIERLHIHSLPLTIGERVVGALVAAADEPAATGGAERIRRELELVATSLASAAMAHMADPGTTRIDQVERISALSRLLSESAQTGTDRDVIRTCAEAFAVWHGIDLRAYVEVADGSLALDVFLPGVDAADAPAQIPPGVCHIAERIELLSSADKDRLGLNATIGAAGGIVGHGRGSWVLLLTGDLDARMILQLDVYRQILTEGIASRIFAAQSRLVLAMCAALAESDAPPERQTRAALAILEASLGVRATLEDSTWGEGVQPRGDKEAAGEPTAGDVLSLVRGKTDRSALALVMTRSDRRPHTMFDRELGGSALDLLAAWSRDSLSRARIVNRRQSGQSVLGLIDQFAGQAVGRGANVCVLVLKAPRQTFSRDLARRCVAGVRADLRAADIAGMIGDDELGVLLTDVTPQQANIVEHRVRRAIAQIDTNVATALVVGTATRFASGSTTHTIVEEARAAAAADAGERARIHSDPSEQR